jgi:hypothetical protein
MFILFSRKQKLLALMKVKKNTRNITTNIFNFMDGRNANEKHGTASLPTNYQYLVTCKYKYFLQILVIKLSHEPLQGIRWSMLHP